MPLKAMLLLGINCGFGNADVGTLPLSALDLDAGWVSYPRPKTGIDVLAGQRPGAIRKPARPDAPRYTPGKPHPWA